MTDRIDTAAIPEVRRWFAVTDDEEWTVGDLCSEVDRLRAQANDWLDVLVWAADSWPEGQPRLDDAINRYEPWP